MHWIDIFFGRRKGNGSDTKEKIVLSENRIPPNSDGLEPHSPHENGHLEGILQYTPFSNKPLYHNFGNLSHHMYCYMYTLYNPHSYMEMHETLVPFCSRPISWQMDSHSPKHDTTGNDPFPYNNHNIYIYIYTYYLT